MATDDVCIPFFLLAFICIQLITPDICDGALTSACIPAERSALLEFKQGLSDPTNRLSSWVGEEEDCCKWEGVACSNRTGHVVKLDLHNPHPFSDYGDEPYNNWTLGGELRPSLLGLKHLKYLDLSMNNFGGINIPEFMGSFHHLQYLNLSRAGLGGVLPHQLGNLSSLQYLDLYNDLDTSYMVNLNAFSIGDALWISHLSSLQYLNLNSVNFQNGAHWLEALNMLPSIVEIYLSLCEIPSVPLSLPHVNFTSLSVLDLSYNSINSTVPSWLFNISGLEHLDLSSNDLQGNIPPAFGNVASLKDLNLASNLLRGGIPTSFKNLCKLQNLILSGNNISKDLLELDESFSGCIKMSLEVLGLSGANIRGQLPEWLFQLRKLKSLELGWNMISGPIPVSLGQLASLQKLSFHHNQLEGVMSEAHFGNLTELTYLSLSSNSLALKVRSNWVPPFQLQTLWMGSCILGPEFPAWLRSQINILEIDMSNAGIVDAMPNWFLSVISTAEYVSISGNQISGHVPNLLHLNNLIVLDLSSNYFKGPLPYFPLGMDFLDLSNNSFSGTISLDIIMNMPYLRYLSLSKNNLSGQIPFSICQLQALVGLDLSKNMLSGEIPNCWNNSSSFVVMDFSSNNISGVIPESICSIASLLSLHLSNNGLSGELPLSMKDCKELVLLDAGHNYLKGGIPTWIGESLTRLEFLNLRSNILAGDIPPNLSRLSALQVLDLADNELSGTIPMSFGNFTAMKVIGTFSSWNTEIISCKEEMLLTTKGNTIGYDKLLSLMNILDLSNNNLFGGVPEELTSLSGLFSLNLSGNHFTGEITENISKLQQLESLDLSRNNFSGTIPSSLAALTSLAYLNLSYNNLSGEIPLGNQLLTFDNPSIYIGNPGLCGFPLKKSCKDSETARVQSNADDRDENEMIWFYTGIAPGFVVGFWIVWGTLILNKKWNFYYFRFIDNMLDEVYVFTILNLSRIKRCCCSRQG